MKRLQFQFHDNGISCDNFLWHCPYALLCWKDSESDKSDSQAALGSKRQKQEL